MAVANTLAYYLMATFATVKKIKMQAPGRSDYKVKPNMGLHFRGMLLALPASIRLGWK
jgi:hypothetical protein